MSYGVHEAEIVLDHRIEAKKVFTLIEAEGIPVCAGDVDKVGVVKTGPNTFIIYADIKSNIATVYWLIEYGLSDDVDDFGD